MYGRPAVICMAAAAAAATARAISQLVVSELHSGYGAAEAAADEAEAAAAVAEFSASMPLLPRLPGGVALSAAEQRLLVAPRGETDEAMLRAIDARLPVCVAAVEKAEGALEALRSESREADERFAAEKDRFVSAAIDGFLKLQEAYRECQRGRVSLKTASRMIEPHVAEAQLLERELRERRQQLVSTHSSETGQNNPATVPTTILATCDPVAVKRKREDTNSQVDTDDRRSALAEQNSNESNATSRADDAHNGKRRRRWSRSSSSGGGGSRSSVGENGKGAGVETADDACVLQ